MSAPLTPPELDLDAIEARARAATPGPWSHQTSRAEREGVYDTGGTWVAETFTRLASQDAAHIAGMGPRVALALVAEVRRLRDEARLWRALAKTLCDAAAPEAEQRLFELVRPILAEMRAAGIVPDAPEAP